MVRIILFAKRPREGSVKTRLIPLLGSAGALDLYRALLADAVALLRSRESPGREVELCLDGEPGEGYPAPGIHCTLQGEGDLGARMLRAFERSAKEGSEATVIVGADAPTLPPGRIEQAVDELLRGSPAVVCPSDDGGYVLIGLRRPVPRLFRSIPWGGERVLQVTRERARESGIRLHELEPWYDVDVDADLDRLRAEFEAGADGYARETRRFLERHRR
jgi:rSAM/selenodomain-associated transferase 1